MNARKHVLALFVFALIFYISACALISEKTSKENNPETLEKNSEFLLPDPTVSTKEVPKDARESEAKKTSETSVSAETEIQDDFSDVSGLELSSEQVKEKLSSIVERTRYVEITNDMDTEEIISRLMDRYLLCVYTYDNTTLFDIVTDENGSWIEVEDQEQNIYYKINHSCFDNLNELEHFVRETFSSKTADRWIKASSSDSQESYIPKFIQREDGIYFCMPKYVYSFPPPFLDNFIIEIKECSETECVFSYNANVDPERFIQMRIANGRIPPSEFDFFHEGKIILEDGKWKIDYVFPAVL